MSLILYYPWNWYPSVVIGFGIWTVAYLLLIAPLRLRFGWGKLPTPGQQIAFHFGTLIALFALVSPLDTLGDEYLFSAHMVQHLLLLFLTAPLWLLGIPGWSFDLLLPRKQIVKLARMLTNPLVSFFIFAFTMIVWHLPVLYNLALEHESLHIFEHLTYLAAAVIGWWPIAAPETRIAPKPTPPVRMLYIFLLTIPCTGLAAILTFAKVPFYPFYITAPRILGLSALADQQLGGLLMWLPTHLVLLSALSLTFFGWFSSLKNNTGNHHTASQLP
jgi:cytochrome c oxidase assembly factor CtaG